MNETDLRTLQRRAYGPGTHLLDDASAALLAELERRMPSATDHADPSRRRGDPRPAAHPAVNASDPSSRRVPALVTVGLATVVAFTGIAAPLAALSPSPHRVTVVAADPTSTGVIAGRAVSQRFYDFLGVALTAVEHDDGPGLCLAVGSETPATSDDGIAIGCPNGLRPASVEVRVDQDALGRLDDGFPPGSTVTFVLGVDEVEVLYRAVD